MFHSKIAPEQKLCKRLMVRIYLFGPTFRLSGKNKRTTISSYHSHIEENMNTNMNHLPDSKIAVIRS